MTRHTARASDYFDRWAINYDRDRISSWFHHYQSKALDRLGLLKGQRFLDVGCGTGWAVRQAAARLFDGVACGVDISPKMIEQANSLSGDYANIDLRVANSESIPFEDSSFDRILCTCSFHHYENPQAALKEIGRVLKPGGTFVLLDSARDVYFPIWLQDRGRRYLEPSHVRYYTTSEMKQLLNETGWNLLGEIETFKKFRDHGKVFTGLMLIECTK